MSHAPGLDRLTRSVPGEGTNGVTIEAAATGDPERSWIVMDHPFLSLTGWSLLPVLSEFSHLNEVLGSNSDDLFRRKEINNA